jgi:hypothetical protein
MHGIYLAACDLRALDFDKADMSASSLEYSNMHQVSCIGTKFQFANLRSSTFTLADLEDSSLLGADLAGSTFGGAILAGVNIKDALNARQQQIDQMAAGDWNLLPAGLAAPSHWQTNMFDQFVPPPRNSDHWFSSNQPTREGARVESPQSTPQSQNT